MNGGHTLSGVKERLKKIYHDIGLNNYFAFKILIKCITKISKNNKDFRALVNLIKLNYVQKHDGNSEKINVVFLYQMPELWNKLDSVCKELIKNEKFNVTILTIPKANITNTYVKSDAERYLDNEALQNAENFYCKVIDARISENEWFDLKSLMPDYVFYQRPYDEYLPDAYRSYNVIKHAKTCYVPYAWAMTTNLEDTCYNREFFRNLYLFYAENTEVYRDIKKKNSISNALNLRQILSLGYPSFDLLYELEHSESVSWTRDKKLDTLRIIWTPRWTTNAKLCASNFFEYKDKFVELARENEDTFILFRPHPMAFENYIKTGLMSQDQIDEYKRSVNELENAAIDSQKDYLDTFWNSDILVTDISSVIVEYFLTGKPIIYCDNDTAPLDKFTTELSAGFYCVKSWDEIVSTIAELRDGKDRLYGKRQELIKKLYGDDIKHSSGKIVESILKDYNH